MNKLKKSLSVLLTLVMLFTTLCFFVLPETGIKANAARAEIQGGYTESVNPVTFSVASNTLKVDVNNVSTTVTAKITNSAYRVKINSITAEMPYESGEALTVSYTAGTVVTGETSFTVTGKIPSTANSVVRYTFTYDVETADGKTLYKNLTGYAYGVLTAYDKKTAGAYSARSSIEDNKITIWDGGVFKNLKWEGCDFPAALYFLQTTDLTFTGTVEAYKTAGQSISCYGFTPTVTPAITGVSVTGWSLSADDYSTGGWSGDGDEYSKDWLKISFSSMQSGYYKFNYDVYGGYAPKDSHSSTSGAVEIYYLNTANTAAGMSEKATAEYYGNLVRGVVADNLNYYVQKNRYTTASWNNMLSALDMAYQVAYAQECESEGFKTACNNASTAYTNLYAAVNALVLAERGVSYDSLFNIFDWHSSLKASSLNNPANGNVFVNVENGTVNIKSNDGVTDLYTNFEDNGKLTGNLYAVDLEANTQYMLLFKVQDGSTGAYQTMVFPYNADGSQGAFSAGGFYDYQSYGSATGWQMIEFTTGSAATKAVVRFGVTSANANVTFSDIHLVKIPAGETAATYAEYLKEIKYPAAVTIVNVGNGKYGTLATPIRDNYDFTGWYFADGAKLTADTEIQDESISVFSKWTTKKFNLIVVDGFGNEISRTQIAYLDSVPTPATPSKEGYEFKGWDYVPSTMPASDVTITAQWQAKKYTVTFMDGSTVLHNITQDFGTSITAPEDPAKTGYEFIGWDKEISTMPASNVTINAMWKAKSYSITYDLNTNDGIVLDAVIGENTTSYTIEDTITLPTVSSTNYNFMGWEVAVNENGNWVTKVYNAGETVSGVYGNVTLRAKWNIKTYTVNWVNWNGIGIETDVVNYGAKPSFDGVTPVKPADAEFTYTFRGWDKNINTPVTEDITFTAQFDSTINSYTVTWNDSDGTKLTEETYLYGKTPVYPGSTPTKVDPTGRLTYTFKGWSPEITAVTGNTTYTAVFDSVVNTYTVTFTYKTADGTEKTVTLEKVAHGTSFTSLIPDDCAEYISGPSNGFEHSHYVRAWTNAVDAITGPADFVADYTLVDNVTMSFADDNKNADCENDGLNSRECSFCRYAHKEVLPAKGHDWKEAADSATCLEAGVKTYLCSRCSGTKEEVSAAKGHSFTTAAPAVPVTCITNGSESYKTCVHCALYFAVDEDVNSENGKADTSSFVIAAGGHKFTLTAKLPATCETAGHEAYNTCSVCTLHFAEDADVMAQGGTADLSTFTITKLGHVYDAVVTEPTCTDKGFTTYTCKNDPTHTYVANYVDAKGHTPGTPVVEDRSDDATCTKPGTYNLVTYCTVCRTKLNTEPKTDVVPHDYVEIIVSGLDGQLKAEKTCYSYAEYYKVCSMCKTELSTETFFDVDGGKLPHTPADKVIEDKTTATCTTPSTWNEVVYCSVTACNHKISSTPVTGEKNPDNHADHGTTTTIKNEVPGTCQTERTWTEVVTCNGCKEVISENDRVGSKNVLNHVNEAEGEPYIDTPGTCIAETVWRVDTRCTACNERTKTRVYKGEKNPEKHTGRTDVKLENSVAGTCIAPETWQVVTYCLDCKVELSRIDKTGNTNPNNHVAESYTQEENVVAGTCTSEKIWDVVTYCSDCNNVIATEHKTGEKDPANHSGVTELRNNKEATCGEAGYTGDLYWSCCDVLEAEGTEIPMLSEHTPGEAVKENEIPATETSDGEYDSVVYCSVCGTELSREHVVHRIERTIRFVLKDKVVEVKAFSGDTVEAPATPEVQTEDGFWHYFMYWDKKIKPVTGDATYTAIYTEPCDYSELESLEAQLKEILADGSVDDETMAANKAEIDATLEEIRRIYLDRNYRDKSEQNEITEVADRIEALIQTICPDLGATLVIEGSVVQYTGRILALRAVKMPSGTEVTDAEWTSSDTSIAFFANGKLYAIGTGTVTFTAQRGILTATKTVTIVEGGDSRGINFTSVDNTSFILEDAYQAKDGAIVYWSDDQPIRFRVHVNSSFLYEKYYVYINGEAAETDMDGYYTIPANSGDVKITIAGEMIDTGAGEGPTVTKWSFWDWLLSFFKKIGDFFRGLFS